METESEVIKWAWLYNRPEDAVVRSGPLAGPYEYRPDEWGVDDVWTIQASGGEVIAYFQYWDEDDKSDRIKANFRLLAAAPELVDAIRSLLAAIACLPFSIVNGSLRRSVNTARKLISQAMGTD